MASTPVPLPQEPKKSLRESVFGPTSREKYQDEMLEAVRSNLMRMAWAQENSEFDPEYATLGEGLAQLDMMIDSQGWHEAFEYDPSKSLSLSQIKGASRQIRENLIGASLLTNGSRIRNAAVWGGGVEFSCSNRTGSKKNRVPKSLPEDLQKSMEETRNARYVFGNGAKEEMERAAFSDGTVFLLGKDGEQRFQRVQIEEITGDLRNPNDSGEIIAYRREWYQNPNSETGDRGEMVRWYYTDLVPREKRKATLTFNGRKEKIERDYTILDLAFNRQVGWAYGIPDAFAAIVWARLYRDFMTNGFVMSRSLARLAFKVTAQTVGGARTAATEIALPGQAGGTAVEGAGNQLSALSTAGRGYDFGSGSPIAAMIAAALGVSLLSLTANPSSATGSNAAAQTLGPVEKATAVMRRRQWDDHFVRIFRYLGLQQRLVTTWSELRDDDLHRVMQALVLLDQLEVTDSDVIQSLAAAVWSIAIPGPVPTGWEPYSKRKAPTTGTTGIGGATSGTGQGQGSGSGTGGTNDHGED